MSAILLIACVVAFVVYVLWGLTSLPAHRSADGFIGVQVPHFDATMIGAVYLIGQMMLTWGLVLLIPLAILMVFA